MIIISFSFAENWSTNSFSSEIGSSSSQIFIPDLKPLTTYNLRVVAVNTLGESEPSQSITIKTEEEGTKKEISEHSAFSYNNTHRTRSNSFIHDSLFSLFTLQSFPPNHFPAPGTAPLSVRVEPLSSKSVRVKWKVIVVHSLECCMSTMFFLWHFIHQFCSPLPYHILSLVSGSETYWIFWIHHRLLHWI